VSVAVRERVFVKRKRKANRRKHFEASMVSTRPSLSFFLAMETNRSYNTAVTARLALFTQRLRTSNVARLDKMAANSVRTHRVLSLRRGRVARVSSAGSPRRTRQTLNAKPSRVLPSPLGVRHAAID